MKIEIDSDKILTEVIERDGSIHAKIKEAITHKLIQDIYREVRSEFIDNKWNGASEIADRVLNDLKDKQTELVKDILKEFYNSYRYKKNDLAVLKELKKFINEE